MQIVGYSSTEIRDQLQELKAYGVRLGESLERMATDLRVSGLSPTEDIISDLQRYRQQFQRLQAWLEEQPGTVVAGNGRRATSIDELKRNFEGAVQAQQALETLDQVRTIAHREGPQHPLSRRCEQLRQQAVEAIRGAHANCSEIARSIIEERHPLCTLRRILRDQEALNDEQWTELLDLVGEQWGREMSIAVARGKLFLLTSDQQLEARVPAYGHS